MVSPSGLSHILIFNACYPAMSQSLAMIVSRVEHETHLRFSTRRHPATRFADLTRLQAPGGPSSSRGSDLKTRGKWATGVVGCNRIKT
jgi:hypothetical protein